MVGRDSELASITNLLERLRNGHLSVCLIEGEPGIGKSLMVGALAERAVSGGVRVLRGRADDVEHLRPFHPIAEALDLTEDAKDPARREAAAILKGTGRAGADPAAAFVEAAVEVLEIEAQGGPALLIIEDLHWADAATLVTLRTAVRRLSDLPLLLVATFRPVPRSSELERWLGDVVAAGAFQIELGPLDDAALEELALEMLGTPPTPALRRHLGRVGGNPLFAVEVIRNFGEGSLEAEELMPLSLSEIVRRGFEGLSPATRNLLEVASTLGSEFRVTDLAAVTGREPAQLLPQLGEALTSRTLRETGKTLSFSHDVVREALYHGLPRPLQTALHRSVAKAFSSAGFPPARVATHLMAAEPEEGDEWLDLVIDVATTLRQSAPGLAADLLQRSIEGVGPRHPRYPELVRASLWPLVLRGRFEEVDVLVDALAAGHNDPLDDSTIREAAIYRHLKRGRIDLFRADLERLAQRTLPETESAWVLSRLAAARVLSGDADGAAELISVLEETARTHPDERERVYCLAVETLILVAQGKVSDALQLAREAAALHGRLLSNVATVYLFVGAALADGDDFKAARNALSAGLREDLEEGDLSNLSVYHFIASVFAYQDGDWDTAEAEADTGLSLYDEGGQAYTAILAALAVLTRLAVHRGDLQCAERWASRGRTFLEEFGPSVGVELFAWAEAHLLSASGASPQRVLDSVSLAWELTNGVRYLLSWRLVAPDLVRWAIAADDRERAKAVAEAAAEGARRSGGIPSAEATGLQCRGLLENDPDVLTKAADMWAAGPRVVSAASAAEDAACAAAVSKEVTAAMFDRAADTWRRLGARRDEARCGAALRRLGVRRPRASIERPAAGWESLTPGELKVAELLAAGLTNRRIAERLFVSPHTVDTHVRHILRKLGMRSRVEVAAEVARRTRRNP